VNPLSAQVDRRALRSTPDRQHPLAKLSHMPAAYIHVTTSKWCARSSTAAMRLARHAQSQHAAHPQPHLRHPVHPKADPPQHTQHARQKHSFPGHPTTLISHQEPATPDVSDPLHPPLQPGVHVSPSAGTNLYPHPVHPPQSAYIFNPRVDAALAAAGSYSTGADPFVGSLQHQRLAHLWPLDEAADTDTLTQGSGAWHAARHRRLTASKVASAVGLMPRYPPPVIWQQAMPYSWLGDRSSIGWLWGLLSRSYISKVKSIVDLSLALLYHPGLFFPARRCLRCKCGLSLG
jgi:hypothetical protein